MAAGRFHEPDPLRPMTQPSLLARLATIVLAVAPLFAHAAEDAPAGPFFNREPIQPKPYAELPLGAIEPQGWLRDELERMAAGMTGNLDTWYPEVCGPRNAWLGGDGDTWERGPYWIDGLYPLARLLDDEALIEKAQPWIEWTLTNQREDGQIGPRKIADADRVQPPPPGVQTIAPFDWWPRMVMLKILQQHYMATGDERVIDCLDRYFRFQLKSLPDSPLFDPDNPDGGSWWAAQRGGENLMSVLWFYNVTGHDYLLELADLIHEQTVPVTDWFARGPDNQILYQADRAPETIDGEVHHKALHTVNLAQMFKTPIIRWQQDGDARHLEATDQAFADVRTIHGQPHGLWGGDEGMHGNAPDRGSELCTAVEMMFSLEKMFEVTGDPAHADRLERITYNALPTQCTDDHSGRQYFQQTNQVEVNFGDRDFFNDNGDRQVFGLLRGYPCCTCNLHQGWPKFAQHLWMASRDGGLAAVAYAPSSVTAKVGRGDNASEVTLAMDTGYPFYETGAITVSTEKPVTFPLHLRIPGWTEGVEIRVNGKKTEPETAQPGTMHVIERTWQDGDTVLFRFPMPLRSSTWYHSSKAIERGPLVYALDIAPEWKDVVEPRPEGVPDSAPHRGYLEARPKTAWNYALPGPLANHPDGKWKVEISKEIHPNPWTRETAPVKLVGKGVPLDYWTMNRHSAANPPLSPAPAPERVVQEAITLIPYGATTLRVAAFPWLKREDLVGAAAYDPDDLRFAAARASWTHPNNDVNAVRLPHEPASSGDDTLPRWTSWPQKGRPQWIEIDLGEPTKLETVGIYFYDDGKGVRAADSWRVERLTPDGWEAVKSEKGSLFGTKLDQLNVATIAESPVAQTIRLHLEPQGADKALGVLSITVEGKPAPNSAPQAAAKPDGRPNFVFFLTDDISPDDLSIYGNEIIRTPNLDRLAKRGLVFDNAYVATSSCSPSRCSIITGRYPHNTGAPELHMPLPPEQVTFVQKLQDAGYHTVLSGKNHMAPEAARLGFDIESDSKPSGSENWIKHLRDRPRDRPFFFWFASHDAHHDRQFDEHAPRYDPDTIKVPPYLVDGPLTRQELADYYHEVSRTDHYAGEIWKELEAQGIADNTWFIYTSDNGRPLPRCKTYLYESGIQAPLLVVGPGVKKPGGRSDSLVSLIDLAPTFLELAGLETPETVQGVSFLPVLHDPSATVRDAVFAEHNWHVYQAHERAVRTGRWLYIRNAWPEKPNVSGESSVPLFPAAKELWDHAEAGKLTPAQSLLTQVPQPKEMLFDVEADPDQLVDVAGYEENRDELKRLRRLLDRWQTETGDSIPENPTDNRQPLHERVNQTPPRGEFPGEKTNAGAINARGPVRIDR